MPKCLVKIQLCLYTFLRMVSVSFSLYRFACTFTLSLLFFVFLNVNGFPQALLRGFVCDRYEYAHNFHIFFNRCNRTVCICVYVEYFVCCLTCDDLVLICCCWCGHIKPIKRVFKTELDMFDRKTNASVVHTRLTNAGHMWIVHGVHFPFVFL